MKKILKITTKVAIFVMLISLTGCYNNKVVELPELPPVVEEISFSTDIQPIFDASCNTASCHDGSINPNLTAGIAFNAITVTDPNLVTPNDADNSELYQRINGGGMPIGGSLTAEQINLVKSWINQGALNN